MEQQAVGVDDDGYATAIVSHGLRPSANVIGLRNEGREHSRTRFRGGTPRRRRRVF